jgi:membrane-associated phospholipid phosphatase
MVLMNKNKYSKFVIFTYIFLSSSLTLYSQPSNTDYVLGYGGLAAIISSEVFLKHTFSRQEPTWVEPTKVDLFFRNNFKWENQNLNKAAFASDILLKGLLVPSIFWTPLITDHNYGRHLLLNFQVVAATGLLTNIAKFSFGRQRPCSLYKTRKPDGLDDNLSFFSGHTSFAFAIATSTAYIFENEYPHDSALIWSTAMVLASATGYLRIAADRHYMTDVLTGAIVGGLTGYLISKNQSKRFFKKSDSKRDIQFYFSLPF